MENCLTVQMLIDELGKIPNKNLYVMDSGHDFIEDVSVIEIADEQYVELW